MSGHYNRKALLVKLNAAINATRLFLSAAPESKSKNRRAQDKRKAILSCEAFATVLDGCSGTTLQERWTEFESTVWKKWLAGKDRPCHDHWTWGRG